MFRRTLVYRTDFLELAAGEVHSVPASWQMPSAGADQKVDILLRADSLVAPRRALRL